MTAVDLGLMLLAAGVSGLEMLKFHVCHHDYERPDMMKCETHDAHVCSLCLSTDKIPDHICSRRSSDVALLSQPSPT